MVVADGGCRTDRRGHGTNVSTPRGRWLPSPRTAAATTTSLCRFRGRRRHGLDRHRFFAPGSAEGNHLGLPGNDADQSRRSIEGKRIQVLVHLHSRGILAGCVFRASNDSAGELRYLVRTQTLASCRKAECCPNSDWCRVRFCLGQLFFENRIDPQSLPPGYCKRAVIGPYSSRSCPPPYRACVLVSSHLARRRKSPSLWLSARRLSAFVPAPVFWLLFAAWRSR